IKFGTSIGDVMDPQTKLRVRLMVYGEFSAKVMDPTKFVIGLVGQRATTNDAFLPWFKSLVQKTMKDGIAELIVKQDWPMLKVTSGAYTDEIETQTLTDVRKHIEPYGVEIIRFGDFSITMDQNDKERLDKLVDRIAYVSGMGNAPGGMAAYQQLAQAEMMMGAAEGMKNGGGGGALEGAGIGMGFAMAGQMANTMGQSRAQAPGPAPAAPTESKEQIMSTLKQLGELKAAGVLTDAEFEAKKKDLLAKL
ncbi:MAG TPA: SPFH domain-containing protein, partial [Kofleriaceae bacterium]